MPFLLVGSCTLPDLISGRRASRYLLGPLKLIGAFGASAFHFSTKFAGIALVSRRDRIVAIAAEDVDRHRLGRLFGLAVDVVGQRLKLLRLQRRLRGEDRIKVGVRVVGHRQDARAVGRLLPMRDAVGGIGAAIHHGVQAQPGDDLAHLFVKAADVDHPCQARPGADDLLLPAQAFDAAFHQRLAAGKADRRFEKEGVAQLNAAFAHPPLQFLEPLRLEGQNGHHVVDL